jgi:hypothetical protein
MINSFFRRLKKLAFSLMGSNLSGWVRVLSVYYTTEIRRSGSGGKSQAGAERDLAG